MPKTFTENERAYIKERLFIETRKCLSQYGIRRTTIDELVKRVGIPKGTFYLFYESKERLLFDVILQFNEEVQADLIRETSALPSGANVESVTDLFFRLYKRMDDSFILRIMQDRELEFFVRTLPPELSRLHAKQDEARMRDLLTAIPGVSPDRAMAFSAALRSIFLSMLYKDEIGKEVFDETLRLLIRGVVMQFMEN